MDIRNIAIIAHVDHGKTTLVDGMLKQTHTFRDNQAEMGETTILDRNALEKEKGITILAKNASVLYKGIKINIIDTPGHADFSGEVERVINMADGALLIVDAAEGPLPQTTFVLQKALDQGLKLIVVVNKIDRKDARPAEVLREVEELFLHLANTTEHLNFPIIYAVGREGKAWSSYPEDLKKAADLTPLFEEIVNTVPAPKANIEKPFKMLVSNLDFDTYKGSFAVGKVTQGSIKPGQSVVVLDENEKISSGKVVEIFSFEGLARKTVSVGESGDIIALTGIPDVKIGQTLADPSEPTGLPAIKISDPTLKVNIGPNTSPFSGKEGKFYTPKQLEERLLREKQVNIGLHIESNPAGNGFIVSGRGELHLAIFIENLRREGYELQAGKPEVILKKVDNVLSEPFEEVTVEITKDFIGVITQEMGRRKGELVDTHTNTQGITRMLYKISSRNLLGFRTAMMSQTRGNGLFATKLLGYFKTGDVADKTRNGALVAFESGMATSYALEAAQERGQLFIRPQTKVYEGMVVGLNSRMEDIDVNVCKIKKLSNVHNATADVAVQIDEPITLSLEQALDVIQDDELLEVTPLSLRIRKKFLTKLDRVREKRSK